MRILVTGGAGFIGSHLCERLLDEGHEVICADNVGSGSPKNVEHLLENDKFTFIKHDVIEPLEIEGKLDQIYHLASRASPKDFESFPIEIAMTNSLGTYNMLNLAKEHNATFLFTSTSEAYGEPKVHPQPEEYRGNVSTIGPRSSYDESKRFGEALTMAFHRAKAVDVKIVRIFNTYGPRMRVNDGRVIPNFMSQAIKDEPITVYGDGSQTRSFCYVSDLVDGLVKMMAFEGTGPKNLGNPHEITVLELAKKIIELTGSKSEIVFKPLPIDDPTRRQPDISKARRLLDWEPKVSLEDGLAKTIEFFKDKLGE